MALSLDLRKRLVKAYENQEESIQAIAVRFKVNAATLWRLLKKSRQTGRLAPRIPKGRPSKFDLKGLQLLG